MKIPNQTIRKCHWRTGLSLVIFSVSCSRNPAVPLTPAEVAARGSEEGKTATATSPGPSNPSVGVDVTGIDPAENNNSSGQSNGSSEPGNTYGKSPRTPEPTELAPVLPELGELTVAAYSGDKPLMVALLARGASVNENIGTVENAITPLIAATLANEKAAVQLLLNNGATKSFSFQTLRAIQFAQKDKNFEFVNLLGNGYYK